jgi:hypothetical protein
VDACDTELAALGDRIINDGPTLSGFFQAVNISARGCITKWRVLSFEKGEFLWSQAFVFAGLWYRIILSGGLLR